MTTTKAQRKASRAYRDSRYKRGDRLVQVWMTSDTSDKLQAIVEDRGCTPRQAIVAAISYYHNRGTKR